MTYLQYVKLQLSLHNGFKLHLIISDEEYPGFKEWFMDPAHDYQNCRAFEAMVEGYEHD